MQKPAPPPYSTAEDVNSIWSDYDSSAPEPKAFPISVAQEVPAPKPEVRPFHEHKYEPPPNDVQKKSRLEEEADFAIIQRDLIPSKEAAEQVRDKDIIILLGDTGVGKTTTINYLAGRKIVSSIEKEGPVLVALDNLPGFVIGHKSSSETRFVRAFQLPNGSFICDAPGLDDTDGINVDVPNAVGIANVIKVCRSVVLVVLIDANSIPMKRGAIFAKSVHDIARFTQPLDPKAICIFLTHTSRLTLDEIVHSVRKSTSFFSPGTPENSCVNGLLAKLISEEGKYLLLDPTIEENRAHHLAIIGATNKLNKATFSSPLSSHSLEKLNSGAQAVRLSLNRSASQFNAKAVASDLLCLKSLSENINIPSLKLAYQQSCTTVVDAVSDLVTHVQHAFGSVKTSEAKDDQACEQLGLWLQRLSAMALCKNHVDVQHDTHSVFEQEKQLRKDVNFFVSDCAQKASDVSTPWEAIVGYVRIVQKMEGSIFSFLEVATKSLLKVMQTKLMARLVDLKTQALSLIQLLHLTQTEFRVAFDETSAQQLSRIFIQLAAASNVSQPYGEQAQRILQAARTDYSKQAIQLSNLASGRVDQVRAKTASLLVKDARPSVDSPLMQTQLMALLKTFSFIDASNVLGQLVKTFGELLEDLDSQAKQLFSAFDLAVVEDNFLQIIVTAKQLQWLSPILVRIKAELTEKLLLIHKKLQVCFNDAKQKHERVRQASSVSDDDYRQLNDYANKLLGAGDLDDVFSEQPEQTIRSMRVIIVQGFNEDLNATVEDALKAVAKSEGKSLDFENKCNRLESLFGIQSHVKLSVTMGKIPSRLVEFWKDLQARANGPGVLRPSETQALFDEMNALSYIATEIIVNKPHLKSEWNEYLLFSKTKEQEVTQTIVSLVKKSIEVEKANCLAYIKSQNFVSLGVCLGWLEEAASSLKLRELKDVVQFVYSNSVQAVEEVLGDLATQARLAIERNSFDDAKKLIDKIESAGILQKHLQVAITTLVSELRASIAAKKSGLDKDIVDFFNKKQYPRAAELLRSLKMSQAESDRREFNKCDDAVYSILQEKLNNCRTLAEGDFLPSNTCARAAIGAFAECTADFLQVHCLNDVVSFAILASIEEVHSIFKQVFVDLKKHYTSNMAKFRFVQAGKFLSLLSTFGKFDARIKGCQFGVEIAKINQDLQDLPETLQLEVNKALGVANTSCDIVVFHASKGPAPSPATPLASSTTSGPNNRSKKTVSMIVEEKSFNPLPLLKTSAKPTGASILKPGAAPPPPKRRSASGLALETVATENINPNRLDLILDQCDAAKEEMWEGLDFAAIRQDLFLQIRRRFKDMIDLGRQLLYEGLLENADDIIRSLELLLESKHLGAIQNCSLPLSTLKDSRKAIDQDVTNLRDPELLAVQLNQIRKSQGQQFFNDAVSRVGEGVKRTFDMTFACNPVAEATTHKLAEMQRIMLSWNHASSVMQQLNVPSMSVFQEYAVLAKDLINSQMRKVNDDLKKSVASKKIDDSALVVLANVIECFSVATLGSDYTQQGVIHKRVCSLMGDLQIASSQAQKYLSSLELAAVIISRTELETHLNFFNQGHAEDVAPSSFSPSNCLRDKILDATPRIVGFLQEEKLKRVADLSRNLSTLALQRLPEVRDAAVYAQNSLLKDVQVHLKALKDIALGHFKNKAFRELELSWVKLSNLQAELGVAIPSAFQGNESDQLAEMFKTQLRTTMSEFSSHYPSPTLENMKTLLIELKVSVSEVSNPIVTDFLKQLIDGKLTQCSTTLDLYQLGVLLSASGTEGMQIVNEYPQFQSIMIKLQQEASASVRCSDALDFLQKNNKIDRPVLEKAFEVFDAAFKSHLTTYALQPHKIGDLVAATKAKAANMTSAKQQWEEVCGEMPLLLAGIFGVWTISKSARLTQSANAAPVMIKPHSVQVLTLFRLLGLDAPPVGKVAKFFKSFLGLLSSRMHSHIAEIVTGGGKSIILGILSTTLALLGFHVHSACYSSYLCERDEADFVDLWQKFAVRSLIKFSTLSTLANQLINESGEVRDLVRNFVTSGGVASSSRSSLARIPKEQRILLIDEVDVFFSSDFYGATYNPATGALVIGVAVQRYIWDNRTANLTLEKLQTLPCYIETMKKLPNLRALLDSQFSKMLSDVKSYKEPNYVLHAGDDGVKRIGYKHHDGVNTSMRYSYKTAFANMFESEQKTILAETADALLGIDLVCGQFSFANIPKEFLCILGVSGTLATMTQFENEVIRSLGITNRTITPSIYGKSNLDEDAQGLRSSVAADKQTWFQQISKDAIDVADERKRAVIIFFDAEEDMQEFCKSSYGQTLLQRSSTTVVTEKTKTAQLNLAIAKSTNTGAITMFPRVFGRGLDFKVFDQKVKSNGGVHIIQTFLSESLSEEAQIKGRTARMQAKGSFQLILCSVILCEKKTSGIAVDAQKLAVAQKSPSDLQTYLAACREAFNLQNNPARQAAVDAAEEEHERSMNLQRALISVPQIPSVILNLLEHFN